MQNATTRTSSKLVIHTIFTCILIYISLCRSHSSFFYSDRINHLELGERDHSHYTTQTNIHTFVSALRKSCGGFYDADAMLEQAKRLGTEAINISVVIATYERYSTLEAIISSLRRQRLVGNVEVVVVDSGSAPPVLAVLPNTSADVVIYRRDDGLYHRGRAFNEGVRASSYDFIALLDDDVIPISEYWAFSFVSKFLQDQHVSVIRLPMALDDSLQFKTDFSDAASRKIEFENKGRDYFSYHPFTTCNVALRKNAWEMVGGFDMSLDGKYGYEDIVFHHQAAEQGVKYIDGSISGCAVHVGVFFKNREIAKAKLYNPAPSWYMSRE